MAGSDTVDTTPWTVDEGDDISKSITPRAGGSTVDLTDAAITAVIRRWHEDDAPIVVTLDVDPDQLATGTVRVTHDASLLLAAANVPSTAWAKVTVDHPTFGGRRTVYSGPFRVKP